SGKAIKESSTALPSFSLPSGFYDGESIHLEINITDPESVIYYTLDGSLPTINSTVYEGPLTFKNKSNEENVLSNITGIVPKSNFTPSVKVNKANVIRAMAKLSDGTMTDVVSGIYFVGLDKDKLYGDNPVISIITDPANLFDYENGIYNLGKGYDDWIKEDPERADYDNYKVQANYSKKGKEGERPATIEYIPGNNRTAAFSHNLGLRLKGKGTRYQQQKSFKLISREEYGKKNINYELIPGNVRSDGQGLVNKYKVFNLRNGGNDSEFAKMRDNVIQDLAGNPFFETQQYDICVVYIDGEYWGLYNIYEEYNDHYIANNYDIDNKNVIVIKDYKVEAGEDNDIELFNELKKFLTETDMSIPRNYAKAQKIFDVEGYAWYSAMYVYLYVFDGWYFGGNWAMWRAREADPSVPKADGKWRMMMYDTEYSTDFKRMFINALCDVKNIIYNGEKTNEAIHKLTEMIAPLSEEHILRNGPTWALDYPEPVFRDQVKKFVVWMNHRQEVFMSQIEKDFNFKPAVNVTITSNNFKKGGFVVNNGWTKFEEEYQGEYFTENMIEVTAKPAKGRRIRSWRLNNCRYVKQKSNTVSFYPRKGCTVTIDFK
ncbi:hypothetical protein PIROE2DRAFT_17415, partial [Piromyces sp. E2]